ncbi:MAG TPA: SRPBCC family protein, partial [Steroidobacteraceae bacterium]|nr:SRPBCC family protein [Steroidobacteraceae bacterium]
PARAFEVFTAGFARWWPRSHSISSVPQKEAVIEPRVGGRWFERGEDGSECDWGKVLVWEPPARVVLGWQLNADFKFDPNVTTEVEVRFIAEGANLTRVELEHRHLERFGDQGEILRQKVGSPEGWGKLLQAFATFAAG